MVLDVQPNFHLANQDKLQFCARCLYSELAVNLTIDSQGVCSACHLQDQLNTMSSEGWQDRQRRLRVLLESKPKSSSGYDCVIPVSGGKDSYFQTHTVLEMGLKPLLVTYHGNNYLPEGQENLDRMRSAFNVDHIVMGPGVDKLREMNRIGFEVLGDMNWHSHAGIKTFPMQLAANLAIPWVFWGEVTWSISGMFDLDDFVTFNKRTVFEHDMRGMSLEEFCSNSTWITPDDLPWLQMPSDEAFSRSGTVGLYIGNFFDWDPNSHTQLVVERYGFETSRLPFQRTYRRMSNLDDMHENGVHDYMKFVKLGYGRATDHASKDIRSGLMTRDEGMAHVMNLDHQLPTRDLDRWLEYAGYTIRQFHLIAEKFRDPRVWWIQDGEWWKANPWGEPSNYGPALSPNAT